TPPDLVPPVVPERVRRAERRRLKLQTGLSWTFTAIGLVGLAGSLVLLGTCDERGESCAFRQQALIAAPIFGVVAAASAVPAVIFTDRLYYHGVPDRELQIGLSAGGLVLRF